MSTYIVSDVFVHLATIKIGRAARVDEEPAAIASLCRERRAHARNVPAGRWIICAEVQGATPTPWPCKGRVHGQFSGALEERSGKGRKASTDLSFI